MPQLRMGNDGYKCSHSGSRALALNLVLWFLPFPFLSACRLNRYHFLYFLYGPDNLFVVSSFLN